MEYQQAVVRAPRMSRINWTQTTTITIAAFIGCLAAIAVLVYVYQSFLGKTIKQRMAKIDQLSRYIDESEEELADLNRRVESLKRRPIPAKPRTSIIELEADDDDETDEENEPQSASSPGASTATADRPGASTPGNKIDTTPAV